jgi:GNAT superfamily N-acetyltransferase
MSDLLELLRWDTEFFGLKIGRVPPSRLDMASLEAVIKLAKEGRSVGLIACGVLANQVGNIQLAGVQSNWRGRGVGTALVQGALDWFLAQGVDRAEVTTQARNVPAQRLYQQMGFFTRRMTLGYHKWMSDQE